MSVSAQAELTGIRKAAILLSLLGDSAASSICDHLPKESLRALNEELSSLGEIPAETANLVLREYEQMSGQKVAHVQTAAKPAEKTLPKPAANIAPIEKNDLPEKNPVSRPVVPRPEARAATAPVKISPQLLQTLRAATPERLAEALQTELPQTIALILVHVEARAASAVLEHLSEESRAQAVCRLAQMKPSSPEIVNRILTVFVRKLTAGTATVSLRGSMEKETSGAGAALRNPMFTFDHFIDVPEKEIRELLSYVDKKTLATALKTASEALRSHFLNSMPLRAATILREDAEVLGNLRARDIARAEAEIVAIARNLEAEGKFEPRNFSKEENG
jgi:flagellar motor switch protein FliG